MADEEFYQALSEARRAWEEDVLNPLLERFGVRKEHFALSDGAELDALYGPESRGGADYLQDVGFPGQYPFTRGVQPTMYRGRLWTMRQYAGFGTAKQSNERYQYLLSQGTSGLSVAFDLPTQM